MKKMVTLAKKVVFSNITFFCTLYKEFMCRRVDKMLANKTIADTEIYASLQRGLFNQYCE